jgi:diguanylate cyclase (GGDEF)-like protein
VFTLTSSISTKIIAAFGVILLIVFTLGGLSIDRLNMIDDLRIAARDYWLPRSQALGQLRSTIRLYRLAEARVAIGQGGRDVASYAVQVNDAADALKKARAKYEPLIAKGSDAERFMRDFDQAWAQYRMTSVRLVRRVAANGEGDLQAEYFGEDTKFYAASVAALTSAINFNVRSEVDAVSKGQEMYRLTRELVIGALVVAAAMCGILGAVLVRCVSMPVKVMTAAMNRLAAHDLTVTIPGVERKDELGAMAKSLAIFKAGLIETARLDGLTGLANRGVFVEAVMQASTRHRRDGPGFAVLYLDLDQFKDVNDTLGHAVGDELLRAVAGRVRSAVRETDTVARFGGDEFAVMSADIRETTDAAALGDKLIKALGDPFSIQGNDIRIGTSIGIAVYGSEVLDTETLLSHADVALYRAKADGRGAYRFFTDSMDMEIRARVTLLAELREAIGSRQLFLVYQPQIEMATGRLVGLEALVRWRHPRRGILGPGGFIREAENSGLIVALSHWVLQEACRQGKTWLDAGILPAGIAVNLSASEFNTPSQVEQVIATTLATTGFPAARLEIELTETVLMAAYGDHHDVLARLRARGIRLAIDDFGTGFSSLDYLRRFPADRIKIDQSFIRHLDTMLGNAAVVKATIGLAREMGIAVIAEGVETERQVELLTAWGCREAQGFYFAKPLTPAELAPLLRSGGILGPQVNRKGIAA